MLFNSKTIYDAADFCESISNTHQLNLDVAY